jgi:hypothetical protein
VSIPLYNKNLEYLKRYLLQIDVALGISDVLILAEMMEEIAAIWENKIEVCTKLLHS